MTHTHPFRPNRVLSRPLTSFFMLTPLKPNHVTLLSAAFGVASGMLFSHGTYLSGLLAAFCYQTAVVLDNCDGEIARAKNMRSPVGAWLDILGDFATDLALFGGLAMGLHHKHAYEPAALLGGLCAFGAVFHLALVMLEKNRGFGPAAFASANPDRENRPSRLRGIFDGLREGEASWFVVVFAVLGRADWLLYAGAAYMQILWISAVAVNFRWTFGKRP